MADVTLTYKGSTIAEMNTSGSKTLKTSGKYCEGDIGVSYVKPSGGGSGPDIPDSAFVISGNCQYWDYNGRWDSFITSYVDKWSTSGITDTYGMFEKSNLTSIPFALNLGNNCSLQYLMKNSKIAVVPTINGSNITIKQMSSLFSYSILSSIPNDYFSFVKEISTYGAESIFYGCQFLRNIPTSLNTIIHTLKNISVYSSVYYSMVKDCRVLDTVDNLGVGTVAYNSNTFQDTFSNCHRLKSITFEENKTAQWKNQTIDLTKNLGVAMSDWQVVDFGIGKDKKVTDATTYAALKNDADWWATDIAYSRYNHDSAVATINSLPDASAYIAANGGTNTIKFKGTAGSSTDGGAINTLTEEEIAVATAKGWTVSLV